MNRLVATKSADLRFHNIHSLGFASYVGATRSLLMSSKKSASIVTPFIDELGVRLLCEAWDSSKREDRLWSVFVRAPDDQLIEPARERGWKVYSYSPEPKTDLEYGLHAKLVMVDEERAIVGSMNLIKRNLYSNLELGVEFDSPEFLWRIGRLVRAFARVSQVVE